MGEGVLAYRKIQGPKDCGEQQDDVAGAKEPEPMPTL